MIDKRIISNLRNRIWLCNSSLDGYILQLQNGGHPSDVAQSYILAVMIDSISSDAYQYQQAWLSHDTLRKNYLRARKAR